MFCVSICMYKQFSIEYIPQASAVALSNAGTTWDKASHSPQGLLIYSRGVKLIFTRGHISLTVAFKGPNVILGLYECNYFLTRGRELGTAAR